MFHWPRVQLDQICNILEIQQGDHSLHCKGNLQWNGKILFWSLVRVEFIQSATNSFSSMHGTRMHKFPARRAFVGGSKCISWTPWRKNTDACPEMATKWKWLMIRQQNWVRQAKFRGAETIAALVPRISTGIGNTFAKLLRTQQEGDDAVFDWIQTRQSHFSTSFDEYFLLVFVAHQSDFLGFRFSQDSISLHGAAEAVGKHEPTVAGRSVHGIATWRVSFLLDPGWISGSVNMQPKLAYWVYGFVISVGVHMFRAKEFPMDEQGDILPWLFASHCRLGGDVWGVIYLAVSIWSLWVQSNQINGAWLCGH